jgi:hypothetical protein
MVRIMSSCQSQFGEISWVMLFLILLNTCNSSSDSDVRRIETKVDALIKMQADVIDPPKKVKVDEED